MKKLGESHPDTLSSVGNLAMLLRKRGDREDSKAWLIHCYDTCVAVVEEGRSDAMACLASAAPLLYKGGLRDAHDELLCKVQAFELQRLLAKEKEMLRELEGTPRRRSTRPRRRRDGPRRSGRPSQRTSGRTQTASHNQKNEVSQGEPADKLGVRVRFTDAELNVITQAVQLTTLQNTPSWPLRRM